MLKLLLYFFCILIVGNSCKVEDLSYYYTPTLVENDSILKEDSEYIIIIGDIQVYTNTPSYYKYLAATMDWIWSQYQYGNNIACVLQTGDITEQNLPHQYEVFVNTTQPIANQIKYISCPGNHDYSRNMEGKISSRESSLFTSYVNVNLTNYNIIDSYEADRLENIIVENYIHGNRYDVISLEFGARKEVIEWTKRHVQAHPERRYILITHEFLTAKGVRISKNSSAQYYFEQTSSSYSTPDYIWHHLVKDNDNIVSVICGHNGFSKKIFTKNSSNRDVPQMLFNIQYQPHGGDGIIQIWEFPKNSMYANVITYNTITRQVYQGEDYNYSFKYK